MYDLGERRRLEDIITMLQHQDHVVRCMASSILENVARPATAPRIREALQRAASTEPGRGARMQLEKALRRVARIRRRVR